MHFLSVMPLFQGQEGLPKKRFILSMIVRSRDRVAGLELSTRHKAFLGLIKVLLLACFYAVSSHWKG